VYVKKRETLAHYDKTSYGEKLGGYDLRLTPQQNWKNISGGWHNELGVERPPTPGNSHFG